MTMGLEPKSFPFLSLIIILAIFCCRYGAEAASKCEVCVGVLQKLVNEISDDDKSSMEKISEKIREICGGLKGKEQKFCFYIGALPESATSIINEVSKPLSWLMPPEKVCDRLKTKDQQICDLKYDKQIDWKTVDLAKLRVKELKNILMEWGEQCKGCTEKSEYVERIKELLPKYVKTEL